MKHNLTVGELIEILKCFDRDMHIKIVADECLPLCSDDLFEIEQFTDLYGGSEDFLCITPSTWC